MFRQDLIALKLYRIRASSQLERTSLIYRKVTWLNYTEISRNYQTKSKQSVIKECKVFDKSFEN